MNLNYKVTTSTVPKNVIEITREQMWKNYMDSFRDIAADLEVGNDFNQNLDHLKTVHAALCGRDKMDRNLICRLFNVGDTVMLLGNAMEFVDTGKDVLVEVIVTGDDGDRVVVPHRFINY